MNELQTLRDLVTRALTMRGVSGRELARTAGVQGFKVTFTTLNAIAAGTYKSRPTDDTLRAIAWLAGVPAEVAYTAAGLPVPGPPFAEELPPGVDNLSQKSRKAAVEILRALVRAEKASAAAAADEPVARRDEVALAAIAGAPEHLPDDLTGEESQDSGSDEPA